ncbi:hypothetical protein GGTG_06133 [Gaeumannomyces tritici R3-111a-1]|uniref:Uncharacterized protein n=1 Tax=Gaeumannomyces tritici (strain R3-111a-1) TaxID=644352 RepID=J3NXX8_GAET3|nr:hypothetical protein GGTG_06133 [Gaeumannomyces tritici R3-111a-1]EJT76211.1 hypothetical protein GGTG_06133 [Gaeumannomyces tritici R3-111a-1]
MKPKDAATSFSWLDFRNGKEAGNKDGEREPLLWLKYAHLDSYFNAGLKAIVPFSEHKPEFPFPAGQERPTTTTTTTLRLSPMPHPTPYVPQPDCESAEYLGKNHAVRRCYLDEEQKVPVPDTLAYEGVPQGLPDPAIGSYDVLGLRSDVCFDRFGRYGPYGLGYDGAEGGTSERTDTEREGSEAVWARAGGGKRSSEEPARGSGRGKKMHRIAVVVRIYVGFEWTQHAVLNFRAMVSELALRSGGEYTMDMRYLGNYYELFDRLGGWARAQSRANLWERSARYYLPAVHGTWANFSDLVAETTRKAGTRPTMGPVYFPGRQAIRAEERGESFLPADTCGGTDSRAGDGVETIRHSDACGRGEGADLITLNLIFDAEAGGWVFASDVTGYDRAWPTPPPWCAIVTASRLSRRLLGVMHEETWRMRHSMFSEMFPAAMALHHGPEAAYAPHPVFLDRGWDMAAADAAFDGGYDASTSGHGSPFDLGNEHNHKGTTWYYNSEFAGLLWRRWLGHAQMDGRAGAGTLRGGRAEEEAPGSPGRLCLRSMLVHSIKWEKPE